MNMELEFHVVKQSIKRTDGNAPVSDSVNYLTAEFNFDSSDWDNTTKTATFRSGVDVYTVLLDENNKCLVPWEVVRAGKLKVSVYGDGANDYRITADTVEVAIFASGYSEGEESQQPTPTQYEQLTGALATKSSVVANPSETPASALTALEIDGDVFSISGSGTEVIANPTTVTTTSVINTIRINGADYTFPVLPTAESIEV